MVNHENLWDAVISAAITLMGIIPEGQSPIPGAIYLIWFRKEEISMLDTTEEMFGSLSHRGAAINFDPTYLTRDWGNGATWAWMCIRQG